MYYERLFKGNPSTSIDQRLMVTMTTKQAIPEAAAAAAYKLRFSIKNSESHPHASDINHDVHPHEHEHQGREIDGRKGNDPAK